MIKDYVVIDLETTGLYPKRDRVIEVGALRVRQGEIVDTMSTFVNPLQKLPERVTEITGITDCDLEAAPTIEDIWRDIFAFLGEDVLIGQRILFDYSFLKRIAVNHKYSFERQGIDTLKIARKYLSDLESRALGSLCQYYKIPLQAHRALEDAKATHQLYQKLAMHFEKEEADAVFLPQPLLYKVKKESAITPAQLEQLNRLLERYSLKTDILPQSLTKNEASRLIDKIRSGKYSTEYHTFADSQR